MNPNFLKRLMTLSALLAAVLATIGMDQPTYATQTIYSAATMQKVIAPHGVLDATQADIALWHDYGAFALYAVANETLATLPSAIRAQVQVQSDIDRIFFDAFPFDTQRETLNLPTELTYGKMEGSALHLIQFVGPIKQEWLDALEAVGVTPVHYVATNAYLVWADQQGRTSLSEMAAQKQFLQYSDLYQPFFKLGPTLRDRSLTGDDLITVTIQMYRHEGRAATEAVVNNLLVEKHSSWQPILGYQNIIGTMRVADVLALAQQPDVYWIGERLERERFDEVQNQIIAGNFNGGQTGPSGPGYLAWLTSYGFSTNPADYPVVDVTDDGVGTGALASGDRTLHEGGVISNPNRLTYVSSCHSNPSGAGPDGHGHINTSIVGGYDTTGGFPFTDPNGYLRGLGVNPFGRMASTRIFAPGFSQAGCGGTDTGVILHSYTNGAQISTNSWGCAGCAGTYDDGSQAYDVGTRDADLGTAGNQQLMFVFAAGNSGSGAGTIGTPGNGKNMLTVGASENQRPTDEDGNWTDGCAVGPTGADNAMDIIGFSSRGPAPGGRIKPEVIAPGTHIQGTASTNASYNGSGVCDQFRPGAQTVFAASSGTSHSTPAVAGVSSLVYYWLQNEQPVAGAGGGYEPSPAVVKAYIMNHPTYLTGVSANDTLPSNAQGYGMPNMGTMFDDTPKYVVDQTHLFDNTGETWVWNGAVADPSKPVRIMMVYTDQAGAIGTSPQVNNLNLAATVGANTYLGNRFSGQWSVTGGTADTANNYEAVFLPTGTTGAIEITITAANIAGDGVPNTGDATDQDFALVCYNCAQNADFTIQATPNSLDVCTPNNAVYNVSVGSILGYNATINLSATGNPGGTTATFGSNSGSAPFDTTLTIGNTGAASFGSYDIAVTGMGPTTTYTSTVGLNVYTAVPTASALSTPADGATDVPLRPTFSWGSASQSQSYFLEVATDMAFTNVVYSATVAGTSHMSSQLLPDTTYYWRVQADNICGDGATSATNSFTTVLLFCSYPNLAIVDNQTVSDPLVVAYSGAIADLDVYVRLDHTWVGDLVVTLHNEATATAVNLIPASFSCSNDNVDATFDDEAANPIACGATPPTISGFVQPAGNLSNFDFSALAATWRLDIADTAGGDQGTLLEWCLIPSFASNLGTVTGEVTDANTSQPVAGATITFDDGAQTYTATTDGSGEYTRPLPSGTYTATAALLNYVPDQTTGIAITDGMTTTVDFVLDAGQLGSSATNFDVTVNLGDSTTANWTLENTGSSTVTLEINARADGYAPSLNTVLAGEDFLIINDGGFNTTPAGAMATALNNLGYTHATITSAAFVNTNVADLLTYQAVLYAGTISAGGEETKVFEFLDAGGNLLAADNDLAFFGSATLLNDYLQIFYSTDSGSDGVINGVDIMSGISTDISSDPFPDDVTLNTDAVGIFEAPSGDWAGTRVERNGYKAVYLGWDFHHAGGSSAGDPVETDILEAALGWLVGGTAEWLSTDIVTATLPVGDNEAIVVTMDAGQVTLPGIYYGSLTVDNDTPYGDLVIPVTMTVACPNCGTVEGEITDALTGDPLSASVQITDTNGFDITLEGSSYSFPLLPGTYYLTATAPDYFDEAAMVNISTGVTTTQDFALTPIFAELIYSPSEIEEDMEIGDIVTNTVTVTNTGTSELTFDVSIGNYGGPTVLAVRPVATIHTAVVGATTRTFSNVGSSNENAAELASTVAPTASNDKQDITNASALTNFQWAASSVLYDNGPLVNCVGCGAGGADESVLQSTSLGLDTLGAGHQVVANNRVADEFEVTGGGWTLDTVTFFAYQTGSSTTSSITAVNVRVWDGNPSDPASNIIFGDDTTNRMISTGWSNIYRVTETTAGATNRPIMASVVDMEGLSLPAGTYWLDWQADGSLASGPWAPPITIDGETTTGNALQSVAGAWQPLLDGGTTTPQGLPFIIEGSGGSGSWASAAPNSGTVPAGSSVTFEVVFDATGVTQVGTFTADLTFSGNFENSVPTMPLTMNITCPTCGILDGTVTDADSGDPLVDATIALDGNGISTSVTGSTYEFAVPAGTYTLTVTADDYIGDSAVVTVSTGETVTTDFALRLNAPNLSANPTSLHATLMLGEDMTQTLTIQNDGAAGTDFTIRELPVFGLNGLLAELIADGSFEAGTPNPSWNESSTNFGTPLCDAGGCGNGGGTAGANTGSWWVWFGGVAGLEEGTVSQDVVIPAGSAELSFYFWIGTTGGVATDYFAVEIDGNEIFRVGADEQPSYSSYTQVMLDVSAYADGNSHEVLFRGFTNNAAAVNFNLDDVSLISGAALDVPWLATDPVTGTVAADSMTDVTVLFDTSVLTQTGSFSAILEVASNDANSPLSIPVYLTVTAPAPAITLDVTVSTANECGTADDITVVEGTVVYYCYTVENTGNVMLPSHTISDTVFGHLTTFTYDLMPGESESVIISQTITADTTSTATWEASHAGLGVSAMASDNVSVTATPSDVYGVDLHVAVSALTDTVGTTVTYTVHITNTGTTTDTFNIALSGNTWATDAPVSIEVGAGEMGMFYVTVQIPANAADGASDMMSVTATSQGDDTQSDSVMLTTTAMPPAQPTIYLPLIFR